MTLIHASDICKLPITDVAHVVKEINWLRKYIEANKKEQKRRSVYMQKYNKERRDYERRDTGNTAARR